MAEHESSKVHEITESPLRAFARQAVALAHADPHEGATVWRIADFIRQQLLASVGQPVTSLDEATPRDRAVFLGIARGTLQRVAASRVRPPTDAEFSRLAADAAVALARTRIRCRVIAQAHRLSPWRPDPDRPGVELARCDACGAGASLRLDDAVASVSDGLLAACAVNRVLFEQEIRR